MKHGIQPNNKGRDRGQELVEFSLILPVVIFVILGMMEYGRAYYMSSVLQNAAREGARYGILHPTWIISGDNADPDNMTARARHFTAGLNVSNVAVSVSYPDGSTAAGNRLRVTVTYPFTSVVPFMPNYTMRGNSTMHIGG